MVSNLPPCFCPQLHWDPERTTTTHDWPIQRAARGLRQCFSNRGAGLHHRCVGVMWSVIPSTIPSTMCTIHWWCLRRPYIVRLISWSYLYEKLFLQQIVVISKFDCVTFERKSQTKWRSPQITGGETHTHHPQGWAGIFRRGRRPDTGLVSYRNHFLPNRRGRSGVIWVSLWSQLLQRERD